MRPVLAALPAGLLAAPAWLLGVFLAGVAGWLVEALGGLVGLAWLSTLVRGLVELAVPPAVAGGAYAFLAHGPDAPWFAGLGGCVAGALLGSAALLFGLPPGTGWPLPGLAAALLGAVGGALGELARPRAPEGGTANG